MSDRPGAADVGRAGAIGLRLLIAAGVACLLAACASDDASSRARGEEAPALNTGLARFAEENPSPGPVGGRDFDDVQAAAAAAPARDDLAAMFERDAALLPSLASGEIGGTPSAAREGSGRAPERDNPDAIVADASPVGANTNGALSVESRPSEGVPEPRRIDDAPSPAEGFAPDARIEELTYELAALLRHRAERAEDPFKAYARLAALEAVVPGSLNGPSAIPSLTPREADQLTAWRDLLRALGEGLETGADSSASSVEALASAVSRAQSRMGTFQSLTIEGLELCTRVDGYGVFTPLPSTRLLAGRAHRAIVYVELDNFTHSAAAGPGGTTGYKVSLEQQIQLFHDADGVLAWRTPSEKVEDFSRNRRREFYTVQIIELPATLTVGAYRLKVTVEDTATGAVSERILPIEIVADPGLAQGTVD